MGEASISTLPPPPPGALLERKKSPAPPKEEEQDDESATVPEGARCKRLACGEDWKGGAGEQRGKGEGDECTYHPGTVGTLAFLGSRR